MENNHKDSNPYCVICHGVLNDDYIEKMHGGQSWRLVYYTYANEWSDKQHIAEFDTLDDVINHYRGICPGRLESEAEWQSDEEDGERVTVEDILDTIYIFFADN